MKSCDMNTGLGQLAHAFKMLKERWADAGTKWTDDTQRQFEKKYLAEIPSQLQHLLAAAQRLTEVLERAERECEDSAENVR